MKEKSMQIVNEQFWRIAKECQQRIDQCIKNHEWGKVSIYERRSAIAQGIAKRYNENMCGILGETPQDARNRQYRIFRGNKELMEKYGEEAYRGTLNCKFERWEYTDWNNGDNQRPLGRHPFMNRTQFEMICLADTFCKNLGNMTI